MKDDLAYIALWDVYAPLLTERQQKIGALYFNYDLSLGEIAEQMSVSRQSVYDCLQTTKNILLSTEEKLGFCAAQAKREENWKNYLHQEDALLTEKLGEDAAEMKKALSQLRQELSVEA